MKSSKQQPRQSASNSYAGTLVTNTRYGIITASGFFTFFAIFYLLEGYPLQTVWPNLAALLLGFFAWIMLAHLHKHQLAAQVILLATFISIIGPALFTGGILSTNMIWLAFIPMGATIMSSRPATVVWGAISIATAFGFYLLNQVALIDLTLRPPQKIDHLVDLVSVILVIIIAAWLNETSKLRYMKELETVQHHLHRQARMDPLTLSDNRRSLAERVSQHLTSDANSVLMLDIDHFKDINDTYGHSAGDQVLQWFSQNCRNRLRQGDILARLGGDEFVIFLPHTDICEAQAIAERLREEIAAAPSPTVQGDIPVTISIGVASHAPEDNPQLEDLLNHADLALYQAKHNGRNRVSISETIPAF